MPRSLSPVVLPGDPLVGLGAGTKQYIDTGLAAKVNSSLLGAVNGVAQLGSGGQVPTAQIPDISATYLNLTGTQSVSGVKTFSSGIVVPQTAAGATNALSRGEADDRGQWGWRSSRWGLQASSMHPMEANQGTAWFANTTASTVNAVYMNFVRCFIPAGVAINAVAMACAAAAVGSNGGGGLNAFGVYEISGTTATLAQNTASTTASAMWVVGWVKAALPSPIAAQGTDREVLLGHAVSVVQTATTGASPAFMINNYRSASYLNYKVDGTMQPMSWFYNGQTSWPATISLTSTANLDWYVPVIGVY